MNRSNSYKKTSEGKFLLPIFEIEGGLKDTGNTCELTFVNPGQPGITIEGALNACATNLLAKYNKMPNDDTMIALDSIANALNMLSKRESERAQRGVLGTNQE